MTTTATHTRARLADGVPTELGRLLPEGICRTFRVLPYAVADGTVLIAVAEADDPITRQVVEERIDRPVQLVRHTGNEISAAIDLVYPPAEGAVETADERRARVQMARMLTSSGLVANEQLQVAMVEYSRTGDPIGDILVAHEAITEDVLVAALSELHQMQRVGLSDFTPDLEVARRLPEPLAQRLQAIPVAATDELVLLAVARPLDAEQAMDVEEALGSPFRQLLANRTELDQLIQHVHSAHYVEVSTVALMESRPEDSASVVFTGTQKALGICVGIAVLLCAVVWPLGTLIGLVAACSLLYLLVSVYKFQLTFRALGTHLETDVTDEDIAALDERTLPMYTILVPLYKEAGIVRRLVRGINELDYPRTRLDVKLLCEEDDVDTIETIRSLNLPPHFHLVVVPDALPKTKPKACNYGLQLATGSFCVIFDAEDRPEPNQLKKAYIAFQRVAGNVACIQAKLNHFNQNQNLLTAWFANEYSMHFELVLPAMGAAGSPIPLGGTSNHFITSVLRELGAWDPFNVTEDADLGIRLHREGYRTAMIDSTTLEEANSQVPNWIRQRSRWIKGYYQTWLVHMRRPGTLLRETGIRGFTSFNLTMANAFVLLLNPIFWTLTTLYVLTQWGLIQQLFPGFVFYAASAMLFVGNFVFVYLNVAGSLQRGEFGITRTALLSPLYWGLMSWAAWKGFIQLFTNPFYWEKTEHGLDAGDHA
ncbi:glycosyltransferase [Nocardioides soli]|uniref:Cellulose synthase/poly-beta-1,6-N-acetylglucosamine synthase-like glycosyltransferase n=1 Tax=Nocardioides soli TaxID=1036020 RepID=A0A7W4VW89_9ACTN|nr:glycosyltransferase [Nocardioides soli]MBB3042956.1 cellulose synthase/poly-beta-1,6-N-acetylglucosamine synthase-like glycosyltransferase [Nocardioides soli]